LLRQQLTWLLSAAPLLFERCVGVSGHGCNCAVVYGGKQNFWLLSVARLKGSAPTGNRFQYWAVLDGGSEARRQLAIPLSES
jgi:hypothetical protein